MQNLTSFLADNGVTMRTEPADHNPHWTGEQRGCHHWRCTIRSTSNPRRSMVVFFSQGSAHNGKRPTPADVLDCLASDASGRANARDFAEWCCDYGFDLSEPAKVRTHRRTYNTIGKQADALKRVLGPEAFEALLYNTERE